MPYAGDTLVGCKNIRQTKIEPSINAFLRISDHRQSNTLHKIILFCVVDYWRTPGVKSRLLHLHITLHLPQRRTDA